MKLQLTTVALENNQHLKGMYQSSFVETYCIGYTDNKRDKNLDGHYFNHELKLKRNDNARSIR